MPIIDSHRRMLTIIKESSVTEFVDYEEAANPESKYIFEKLEWVLSEDPVSNAIDLQEGNYEIECCYFSSIGRQKTAVVTYRFNEKEITWMRVHFRTNLNGI